MRRLLLCVTCLCWLASACGDGDGPGPGDRIPDAALDAPDASDSGEANACVHSPYDGFEPACDFAPGPDPQRDAPEALPTPAGECPGFTDGVGCVAENDGLTCTFHPAGQGPRTARVWLPPGERTAEGPLVFYFYGLLGFPDNAVQGFAGFPPSALQPLFDAGGILVAPKHSDDRNPVSFTRLPWIGALGLDDDARDFELVDEIVGCLQQELGIDARRIHATGLSAGGWMTAQVMVHRSSYIASAALFSGGLEDVSGMEDASNKLAVAMFHGGTGDHVGAHFENEAQSAVNRLRTMGHFAVSCNHGGGHSVPEAAAQAGMRFMLDHPYGTVRSPYCDAAPEGTEFCALQSPAELGVMPESGRSASDLKSCSERALEAGVTGDSFDEDMLRCACDRCGSALWVCLDDPGCSAVMKCAAEKGCMGISCSQDALCGSAIADAGGVTGAGPQLAVAFADCMGAAACETCGAPELAD